MLNNNRRQFVKTLVATSGGLFVVSSLSAQQPQGKFIYGEQVNPNQLKPGAKPRFSLQALLASEAGSTLSVIPKAAPVTIYPSNDLLVWKGSESEDFSGLRAGDNLYLTGQIDPSGKLLASRIWANIVNISGTVMSVSGSGFQIVSSKPGTNLKASVGVAWRSDTIINEAKMTTRDVQAGMSAQVIGLVVNDGSIHATRVLVHNTSGHPLGWQGEPILPPYTEQVR